MRIISDNIKKWMNWDIPANEPPKLCEEAPDEVKKEFEEWKRQCEEDEANDIFG